MTSWEDGVNVDMNAEDFIQRSRKVKQGDTVSLNMYDGGGFVAIIK